VGGHEHLKKHLKSRHLRCPEDDFSSSPDLVFRCDRGVFFDAARRVLVVPWLVVAAAGISLGCAAVAWFVLAVAAS